MTAELPPEIAGIIEQGKRDGVFYTVRRLDSGHIKTVHWRPGDRNALAEAIISKVHQRTELELDGHHYWIEPRDD